MKREMGACTSSTSSVRVAPTAATAVISDAVGTTGHQVPAAIISDAAGTTDVSVRMGGGKRALEAFRHLFSHDHSYEDAQNLLETVLLISALLLAFAVGGLQNLSHDDMMKADARMLALFQDPAFLAKRGLPLDEQQRFLAGRWIPSDFVSYECLRRSYDSLGVQLATLTIAIALYVSLSFSSAREDTGHFQMWMYCCKWIIAVDYCLLMVGIFLLFASNQALINMKFPLYSYNLSSVFDNKTATMVEGGDWMIQDRAGLYWLWIQTAVGSIIGFIFLLHFVLVFGTKRQTLRSNLEASTAFEKWESVLDKAGMDFKTCASIHDDLLLRKELEKAGVCIPGDRLNIILELRKAQTQTTEIRTDNNYSGGVSQIGSA